MEKIFDNHSIWKKNSNKFSQINKFNQIIRKIDNKCFCMILGFQTRKFIEII